MAVDERFRRVNPECWTATRGVEVDGLGCCDWPNTGSSTPIAVEDGVSAAAEGAGESTITSDEDDCVNKIGDGDSSSEASIPSVDSKSLSSVNIQQSS